MKSNSSQTLLRHISEANVKSASRILREYKAKHIEDDAPEGGGSRKK
eukprot:SAG11_NODE_25372_length_359_cov_3.596154_1_plen_46_part_10